MKRRLKFILMVFIMAMQAQAQELEVEKTYKISRASKRGDLAGVDFDQAAQTYTLTYFTDLKKKGDKAIFKYEQYVFDADFNFIKDAEYEEEADLVKKKFKWFRFKGEEYVVHGNTVDRNLMGALILRKKEYTYKYSVWSGRYSPSTKVLDKVKPKRDDGKTYQLVDYIEDEMSGDLYILATAQPRPGAKGNDGVGDMFLLKYNSDLEQTGYLEFNFPYKQALAFMQNESKPNEDDPDSPGVSAINFVFAPTDMYGKKQTDPDNNNYTYVRINDKAQITDKFNFLSPASYWRIDQLVLADNGDRYFYGPAQAGKDKYFNDSGKKGVAPLGKLGVGSGEIKFKAIQLMKVVNGKMIYITSTDLDEIKGKRVIPPGQKKSPEYEGREFMTRNFYHAPDGDFIIIGQNYDIWKSDNAGGHKTGDIKRFEDVLGFHFDGKGTLRAQYAVDTKESGVDVQNIGTIARIRTAFSCPQQFISTSGQTFWLLREVFARVDDRLLTYPRIGKVDIGNARLGEFMSIGKNDQGKHYLDNNYPMLETDKAETIIFFGADKPGKEIWFARVKLK